MLSPTTYHFYHVFATKLAPRRQYHIKAAMQDDLVWDLLLGELWQPLDQSVVLKLMCCSRSMMELVHSKCEGGWKPQSQQHSSRCSETL
jgi:hypothetical protein